LLFVDGRDQKQLDLTKRITAASDRPVKLVLVAGEPLNLMRKWKTGVLRPGRDIDEAFCHYASTGNGEAGREEVAHR